MCVGGGGNPFMDIKQVLDTSVDLPNLQMSSEP